jgi:hypothetical protein
MRRINTQGVITGVAAAAQIREAFGATRPPDVYTITPAHLRAAEEIEVRREREWRQAGALQITEGQVDQALQNANGLQSEFDSAKERCRRSFRLRYLNLVRLFVLTSLPRHGKMAVIGGAAAVVCGLSLISSPLLYSSIGTALLGSAILTVLGSAATTVAGFVLWPTEAKRQAFNLLNSEWKSRVERANALEPTVQKAWAEYRLLDRNWTLLDGLLGARQRRSELTALLASAKYQLIHTDWRSMRGTAFEDFLARVFEALGYQVKRTKASGDQGVDLIVTGNGRRIAVQAKGYSESVGNHAVMEIVAGMTFYQCDCCVVITNSHFTSGAVALARANKCRLIDGSQIPDLIEGRVY